MNQRWGQDFGPAPTPSGAGLNTTRQPGGVLTLIETDQCCSLKVTTLALVQGSAM